MPRILLCLVLPFFTLGLFAQEKDNDIYVYGSIMDCFTWEKLKGVNVEVKDEKDSTLHTFVTKSDFRISGEMVNFFLTLEREKKYSFHFTHTNYEPFTLTFTRKTGRREKYIQLGDILLKKRKSKEIKLNEVTVTASKIRMVVKGDTIEYNADAFQLAEGSMLDGLMKMLPGFEIENGQIRVNGQHVSTLLVNGDDFFKGDPRIALDNLPAYMVNKIKVYRKEHDWGYLKPTVNKDELPLVVDVHLKKEYTVGWTSNTEVGYGTENRYMARLFGLLFTNHSRFTVYGNANNTNDKREPGTSGDWKEQDAPPARTALQTTGIEALVQNKEKTWKYTGNLKFYRQQTNEETFTSSEKFFASGTGVFGRMAKKGELYNLRVVTAHQLDLKKRKAFSSFSTSASYQHERKHEDIMRGEFSSNPFDRYRGASLDSLFLLGGSERLTAALINNSRQQQKEKGNVWKGAADFTSLVKMAHSQDNIHIKVNLDVEHREYTSLLDYTLFYQNAPSQNERRHPYGEKPKTKVNAHINLSYYYKDDWGRIEPYIKTDEKYADIDYALYRLDWLVAEGMENAILPSSFTALQNVRDKQNSYTSQLNNLTLAAGAATTFFFCKGKSNLQFRPEVQWRSDHLIYHRNILNARPTRNTVLFTPALSFGFDDFRVSYNLSYSEPDLICQQAYVDDSDPLNIYKGNPYLRRSTHHRLAVYRNFLKKKWTTNARIDAYANITQNAIANGVIYESTTGVSTYQPRNVNGNWGMGTSFSYTNTVDKKKQVVLTNQTALDYRNSVDFVSERSVVRNLNLREQVGINAKWKQNIATAKVGMRYLHAASPRENFETINSFDLTYALTAQRPLLWGIHFTTDLTLYQRVGYSDDNMNELRFVMNAGLAKSILKGQLSLMIDAFDIFHGLSNVTKTVNAQGFVETWTNSLPPYFMFRLGYRLNKKKT